MMIPFSRPASAGFLSIPLLTAAILGGTANSASAQYCGCTGNIQTYCTAGTSVQGCLPSISGVGVPNVLANSGFDLVVSNVPGQRYGTIFYGFYSFITPWAPGSPSFKCVASPVQRMGNISTGGTIGQCNGEVRLDFNAWMATHPAALGGPFSQGQTIRAQGWYRDPAAPGQTNLSNALTFTLCGSNATICAPPGFVAIQPGTFQMGHVPVAMPVHSVTISYPFWMCATEVTQAQFASLMGINPSYWTGGNFPVYRVTWTQAIEYCTALTAQQAAIGAVPPGYEYRLPTEAEWEYACRAGTTTYYYTGNILACSQANVWTSGCTLARPTPVGSYPPNPWGLFDMYGNAAEWCLDSSASYTAAAVTDPFVTLGSGSYRVVRGGSFLSVPTKSAERGSWHPEDQGDEEGFRVVLAPILVP